MTNERILIVEDEAIIAMELERSLQNLGYAITSIENNGADAIRKAGEDRPDLILMDIRIQGDMDGIEAAEVIRNRYSIPVVFSTAFLDREKIERAKLTMPFGYLLKPIQERDLRITIEMALYAGKVENQRKASEQRLVHINNVLRAIRNVNQMINQEKDRIRLITQACSIIAESRGLYNVWICLLDQDLKRAVGMASSSRENTFDVLKQQLAEGRFPGCMQRALGQSRLIATAIPNRECPDCPLSASYAGRSGITAPLKHGDRVFGLMALSVPEAYAGDPEEQSLVREMAEDLAFALAKLEKEEDLQRLGEIIRNIRQPMSFVSPDYRYLAVNDAYTEIYGTTRRSIVGASLPDLLGQAVFENDVKPHLDRCLAGEEIHYQVAVDFSGVGHRWMQMAYFPALDAEGRISGVVSHGQDISRQKAKEQQLQESEQRCWTILENLPLPVFAHDPAGRFVFVNRAAERLTAWSREELLAMGVADLDADGVLQDERKRFWESVAGDASTVLAVRQKRKDGTLYQAAMHLNRVTLDGQGIVLAIAAAAADV